MEIIKVENLDGLIDGIHSVHAKCIKLSHEIASKSNLDITSNDARLLSLFQIMEPLSFIFGHFKTIKNIIDSGMSFEEYFHNYYLIKPDYSKRIDYIFNRVLKTTICNHFYFSIDNLFKALPQI